MTDENLAIQQYLDCCRVETGIKIALMYAKSERRAAYALMKHSCIQSQKVGFVRACMRLGFFFVEIRHPFS
jgi:hypothetical protein